MTPVQTLSQLTFSITGCKCTNFDFTDFGNQFKGEISSEGYQFLFELSLDIKKDLNVLTVLIKSELSQNIQDAPALAKLSSEHQFKVIDLNKHLTQQGDQIMIPDGLLIQFFSISVGNLRGMYSIKLDGSPFSNAVLPAIDPTSLLPRKQNAFA